MKTVKLVTAFIVLDPDCNATKERTIDEIALFIEKQLISILKPIQQLPYVRYIKDDAEDYHAIKEGILFPFFIINLNDN